MLTVAGIINVRNEWPLSNHELYNYANDKYGDSLNSTRFFETTEVKNADGKLILPKGKVVGLSKINRLVDYYAHRPQVQERLCLQILKDLQNALETDDVIVMINAVHLCVSSRGIKDKRSSTTTMEYGGCFSDITERQAFLKQIDSNSQFNCV